MHSNHFFCKNNENIASSDQFTMDSLLKILPGFQFYENINATAMETIQNLVQHNRLLLFQVSSKERYNVMHVLVCFMTDLKDVKFIPAKELIKLLQTENHYKKTPLDFCKEAKHIVLATELERFIDQYKASNALAKPLRCVYSHTA